MVSSGNNGPTAGLVMADTDGDGADEVYSCDVLDCSMGAADFNGDGIDEIVNSSITTRVTAADGNTQILPSGGHVFITDINDDGRPDLTLYNDSSGTLSIHQGMSNGVAPAVSIRTVRPSAGAGFLGDVDRDGSLEFLTVDPEGKLIHTRASN